MKEQIEFSEFLEIKKKLDIKIGQIKAVEEVPKSKKLLKLTVDFGNDEIRTVVTNIGDKIDSYFDLISAKLPFIMNLKPVDIMGINSTAMIMVCESPDGKVEFQNFTVGAKLL